MNSFSLSGEKGRKLQSAIYDRNILCHQCEEITSHLDDYGIRIFRDRLSSFEIAMPGMATEKIIIYENIDKAKLRRFLASVLWRISVSNQLELKDVSIGNSYERRIANDIFNQGEVSYIDAVIFFLSDPRHGAVILPYKKKIEPLDKNRDYQSVNGWLLNFPNISISLSLDKRPHPQRLYYNLSKKFTEREEPVLVSTSLLANESDYRFMVMETSSNEAVITQMALALKRLESRFN
ncbi:hypothetical protein [Thiothrix sp.]|uniref:hypothetical protein n=1 Tax=Thiothrix sp. TaxID=1032 RepID=UPI00257AD592|nr:hypothetical protein [Thiothrix sp.]